MNNKKRIKKFLVDIFALNSFLILITIPNELLIAKLTLSQWVHVRTIGIFVNTLTAIPYSIFREKIFKLTNTNETKSSWKRKYAIDTVTFSIFQLPLYCTMLYFVGSTLNQIIIASIPVIIFSSLTGRPYGIYLEWLRKKLKVN